MLKINNKIYLYAGLVILLFFLPFVERNYLLLFSLTILNLVIFFGVINSSVRLKPTKLNLSLVVLCFSMLFVGLNNCLSFLYEQNFFMFSFMDAEMYHEVSKQMSWMPFDESVSYYLESWGISDLGAVVIISTLYRIIESNLFYNFLNIVFSLATALGLFRISCNLMSRRYAFVCALSFTLSSYLIWFHSSGHKESFMVMVVVLFFDHFYMYLRTKKVSHIFLSLLFVASLLFFRPAIIFFCIMAVGFWYFFSNDLNLKKRVIYGLIIIGLGTAVMLPFLEVAINRFARGGDIALMIAARESTGMVIGSLPLTYSVNILAQLIGPLPSLLPNYDPKLSLYSAGLIYRVILAFPFWLGVYYAFKYKRRQIYPLIVFSIIEMGSLALILEGLELRKALLHFPMIYIVAFWFLNFYEREIKRLRKGKWLRILFRCFGILIVGIIVFWNLR